MKKLFLPLVFCILFIPNAFGATRTISDAGGNWNDTATWEEAAVPNSSDAVVAQGDGTSGNVTLTADASCASADFTNYTGTLTLNTARELRISGSLTLASGMTLVQNADIVIVSTGTVTTNGVGVLRFLINASSGTVSLGDNFTSAADKNAIFRIQAGTLDLSGNTLSGNSASNRLHIFSTTIGTAANITVSGGTFANIDFTDITLDGATDLSGITGGSGDCGGNTNITFTTADTMYWHVDGGDWSDSAKWFLATNGGGGSGRVPLPQDDVVFDANSFDTGSQTVDMDMPRICRSVDWTGATNTPRWTVYIKCSIYGSITLISNMATTGANQSFTFAGRGAFTFTRAGQSSFNSRFIINMFGGSLTMQDAWNGGRSIILTRGTFDANDFDVTPVTFDGSGTLIRTLTMGNGSWNLASSGTNSGWKLATTTNLTFNVEAATINMTYTGAATIAFFGGSLTYNAINITGGPAAIWFTGSNTFTTFTVNKPKTLLFDAGTTTTVSSFVAIGDVTDGITITSKTSATHTLSDAGGTNAVEWCDISYSIATGGATWDALVNCTDSGNNTGWNFAVAAGIIKTWNGLAWGSVKTFNGLAVGSIKTINGAATQ